MTNQRACGAIRRRLTCRTVWVLGLLVLGAGDSSAQTFGVRGGVDSSTVRFEDETSSSAGFGWTVGGAFVFGSWEKVRFGAEALLTARRVTVQDVVEDALTYVELPLLVRMNLVGSVDEARITAVAGAVPRVLVRARETVGDSTVDIKEALSSSDVGVTVGADIRVLPPLDASVRYVHGFTGVYNAADGSRFGKVWSLQFGVTYWLK